MGFITTCDGCGSTIGERPGETPPGMEGNRADELGRMKVAFHWCRRCAGIGRNAVQAAQPADAQADADKISGMAVEAMENPGRTITR